jgi:hypothetical protein
MFMKSSRRFSYSGAFETSLEENWACYYFISFCLLKPCYLIWVLVILKDLFLIEINGLFDLFKPRAGCWFKIWAALKWVAGLPHFLRNLCRADENFYFDFSSRLGSGEERSHTQWAENWDLDSH